MKHSIHFILCLISVIMILSSCTVARFIDDDELFLSSVNVVSDKPAETKQLALKDYIRQTPNTKWFGIKIPLSIYCLSGVDTTNWATRFFRRIGEDPVIYDEAKSLSTQSDLLQVLNNNGFMQAQVSEQKLVNNHKLRLTYSISSGAQYHIRSFSKRIEDTTIRDLLLGEDTLHSLVHEGMVFNVNILNEERNRITSYLRSIGYYKFNKDYITFTADTCVGSTDIDLTMNIRLYQADSKAELSSHHRYRIGKVTYDIPDSTHFRASLLPSNTLFRTGKYYNEFDEKNTYNYLTRLQAVNYSNIRLTERSDSDILDCNITVTPARQQSIGFELEGTNSAGDLGAAASASYIHKNIFKGSEKLLLKFRGAYEAITGLEGYEGNSYVEAGTEVSLAFPGFLMPYISQNFGAIHSATSEVSVQYNFQNRPEFERRVLTAAWKYRWYSMRQHMQHRLDMLEVNYVRMPWVSKTFREQYLDSLGKTNAILKYNYEDLLITKLGYSFTYNSLGTSVTSIYGKDAYTIRFNLETSGNVLGLFVPMFDSQNSKGQYTMCGIAFAQYARGDFDFVRSIRIDKNNSLALHLGLGVAYPYGNSDMLPFEKRYFSGGANSVRGWSVRSLGPGSYSGADKNINFLNQSGDIKLDFSLEYRTFLFWKINGAAFIDAGNIWTIRNYVDQPGGQFRLNHFYKEIALAYGLGLRFNFDFFVLRFDAGMKAINPAYEGNDHYPIIHPNLSRDFAFHFAVGLPF
ncbi:MAG: outer membrane protein assembly factor [Bacteroidaceae bacterium]|nr:outer membrane protein assembly factor [Bacteroidaceae bacterium]